MSPIVKRSRLVLMLEATMLAQTADIAALCGRGDIASCIIEPVHDGTAATRHLVQAIRTLQDSGVAALIADRSELAQTVAADGVHLSATPDLAARYEAARKILGAGRIIGVESPATRHEALALGEAGADYVAFALPGAREQLEWWAEVVEIPAVALGPVGAAEAAVLARAGVEFIAVPPADIAEVEAAVAGISLVGV